jgi:hypothetical protein
VGCSTCPYDTTSLHRMHPIQMLRIYYSPSAARNCDDYDRRGLFKRSAIRFKASLAAEFHAVSLL